MIKFYFDSLTIYTDSSSLFYVYRHSGTKGLEDYSQRVKSLVRKQFLQGSGDTIAFSGDQIPFNDGIDKENQKAWYVGWAIPYLARQNLLKMFDRHGQLVKAVFTKRIATKKKGYVRRAFINKDTKEELFHELLFLQTVERRYRH